MGRRVYLGNADTAFPGQTYLGLLAAVVKQAAGAHPFKFPQSFDLEIEACEGPNLPLQAYP